MHLAIYAPVFVRPTETFIYDVTTELARGGANLTIITGKRELEPGHPLEPIFEVPKPTRWNPVRLGRRLLRPILGRPPGSEQAAVQRAKIRRILQKNRPDVLIANYGQSGVLLSPLAKELDIPLFVSFHGVDASTLALDPAWQRRYRSMFESAAIVTGPSEYVRNKLIGLGCAPEKAHVLHYGIRTDRIRFLPPGERFDSKEIRFLFVGRLAEKKDPITLLRSFKKASEALLPMQCTLTMVGDGPLREKVENEIKSLSLSNSVRLTGRQTHDEVIRHFANAHIYVQHSVTAPNGDEEGLPVSITEALASGLPVIATRHSGIPEAVHQNVCGLLVNEKDWVGMADCMVQLAKDPELCDQFGSAGRRLLEKEFATPIVQKRLKSLLLAAQKK